MNMMFYHYTFLLFITSDCLRVLVRVMSVLAFMVYSHKTLVFCTWIYVILNYT